MNGRGGGGRCRNPCLTMHQPWASLLVHGIKRIEGRSWPAPLTGRLWIHAASKILEPDTIKAMENFYREIYAVDGINDIKFPKHYPVSRLIGCVEIVGCLKREELVCWEKVPQSKLVVPFEMRGFQGVYNLENKIYESAVRGLTKIEGPLPVKFPFPGPRDFASLHPGSHFLSGTKAPKSENLKSVSAAIAGARAAATQFSKRDVSSIAIRKQTTVHQKLVTVKSGEKTMTTNHLNPVTSFLGNVRIQEENQAPNIDRKLMLSRSGDKTSQQSENRILVPCGTAKLFSEVLKSSSASC